MSIDKDRWDVCAEGKLAGCKYHKVLNQLHLQKQIQTANYSHSNSSCYKKYMLVLPHGPKSCLFFFILNENKDNI